MKESLWGYWIIVLGVSILSIMILLQSYTTTSEQDYYLVKNILESSMYESVNYGYFRDTGGLKIDAEKLVENFVRRFSDTVNISKNYTVAFYDIYEEPPAASVAVVASTEDSNFGISQTGTTNTIVSKRLTGILYTNGKYESQKS